MAHLEKQYGSERQIQMKDFLLFVVVQNMLSEKSKNYFSNILYHYMYF